ncbi:MAG: hypothetical protein NVSMB30_12870 [Hymenobacter sp.]
MQQRGAAPGEAVAKPVNGLKYFLIIHLNGGRLSRPAAKRQPARLLLKQHRLIGVRKPEGYLLGGERARQARLAAGPAQQREGNEKAAKPKRAASGHGGSKNGRYRK